METTDVGTETTPQVDADSPPPVELQTDNFNLRCARHGAYSLSARARLIGVDRTTLIRWYGGPVAVPLSTALHVSNILECKVDELWRQVEVAA